MAIYQEDEYKEVIAKPAEPVNGQDERRINAPSLTASPVFVDG